MADQDIKLSVPGAIVIAGIIVALSILVSKNQSAVSPAGDKNLNQIEPLNSADIKIKPVGADDHIWGSLSAPVKIVEFSDPECPFCKMFYPTMKRVMDVYGQTGQVAWVYRNFPLDSLHPKARRESEALECAGEQASQGGRDTFFAYLDRLMEITPSNNRLDPAKLFEIAAYIKLDQNKFADCLNSGKYVKKVQASVDDALAAGGQGTPYSVVIAANGKKFTVDGAYSYDDLKPVIDQALRQK